MQIFRRNPRKEPRTEEPQLDAGAILHFDFEAPLLTEEQIKSLLDDLCSPLCPVAEFKKHGLTIQGADGIFGPFHSWEQEEEYKEYWVSSAPSRWIASLLQICPTYENVQKETKAYEEKEELWSLLSLWVEHHPVDWSKIFDLISDGSAPSIGLHVWARSGHLSDETVSALFCSLANNISQFKEDELISLIDGIGNLGTEKSGYILDKMKEALPNEMKEAQAEIEHYRRNPETLP